MPKARDSYVKRNREMQKKKKAELKRERRASRRQEKKDGSAEAADSQSFDEVSETPET